MAQPSALDIGTLITGVATAVGTIGAVIVALWIARKDRKTAQTRDEKDQARKISVWLTGEFAEEHRRIIAVANASTLPVHNVFVGYGIAVGAGSPTTRASTRASTATPA